MGEVFAGRYELVDLLGQGGMGSVWRVWDHRQRSYLAAKVLGQADAASLLRFVREQALRIEHPHVVAPRGWAAEDDRVLFTMDIVAGGPVSTLLDDHGPLPASYVACLIDQLLSGLAAVHAAKVVHRDLKPGNLLLEATGRDRPVLRLSDFGIAVRVDEPRLTYTGQFVGTHGYLAPELRHGADPDPRQDLYAAGVLGAELLTGSAPGPVPAQPSSGVPEQLWSVLRDLAAPRLADRPESAEIARRRLADLLPGPGKPLPWQSEPHPPEVRSRLAELPPGWTAMGPRRRSGPGPITVAPAVPGPVAEALPASAVGAVPAVGATPASVSPTRAAPVGGAGIGGGPADPRKTRTGRPRWLAVVTAAVVVAAGIGAAFVLPQLGDPAPGDAPPTGPSQSTPSGATTGPGAPKWTYPVVDITAPVVDHPG